MAEHDFSVIDRAGQCQAKRETVVLLHSSASSGRQWSALVELLQPRFNLRTVDLHGHGTQPDWSGDQPLTLADEAALVKPLLWEAGGAHVIGHSYGGAVALKLATTYPHLVRSLVAYEPVLFGWMMVDGHWEAVRDVIVLVSSIHACLERGDEHAAAAHFIEYWSGQGAWELMSAGRQQAVAARMRAVLPHFAAVFREPFQRLDVGGFEMPMLFLRGEYTVDSTRRIGALLRQACPYAEHSALAGMAHMGPITHATEVNRRIQAFLVLHAERNSVLEELCEVG
jgi:pimeloyl-ACP methyl ester carboxylesterase